jgi:hypothetical protein
MLKTIFCQDRLRTSIGKLLRTKRCFLQAWCGIPGLNGSDVRATDPQALDCESWSMPWNFTAEAMAGKKTVFCAAFYSTTTKTDHFTKTGPGQA